MARMTRRMTALVAFAVIAPLKADAQNWTASNINGLRVLDRDGPGVHQRAVQLQQGWYIETSFFDSNRRNTSMRFETPEVQSSNRIDEVVDTNGDNVFDTGYQWIVGRGWQAWPLLDVTAYRTFKDQAYARFLAAQGTSQVELMRLYYVRADKFYQTMDQMVRRGHNP